MTQLGDLMDAGQRKVAQSDERIRRRFQLFRKRFFTALMERRKRDLAK
jgi:hypothetical protein